MLTSLPLYFFAFFKALKKVLKTLVGILRNFLWGGCTKSQKVSWVNWDQVCLPKSNGRLGVKNLELFNIIVLEKWKWRFLVDPKVVWFDLLCFKYDLINMVENHNPQSSRSFIW